MGTTGEAPVGPAVDVGSTAGHVLRDVPEPVATDPTGQGNEAKFPSAKELGKRLGVSEEKFHRDVKPEILKQFKKESNQIGSKNPNVGVDESGNIVLQNPKTKQTVETGLPLDSFGE